MEALEAHLCVSFFCVDSPGGLSHETRVHAARIALGRVNAVSTVINFLCYSFLEDVFLQVQVFLFRSHVLTVPQVFFGRFVLFKFSILHFVDGQILPSDLVKEILETLLDFLELVRNEPIIVVILNVNNELLDPRCGRVGESHKVLDFNRSLHFLILDIVGVQVCYHQVPFLFHVEPVELDNCAGEFYFFSCSALDNFLDFRRFSEVAVIFKSRSRLHHN